MTVEVVPRVFGFSRAKVERDTVEFMAQRITKALSADGIEYEVVLERATNEVVDKVERLFEQEDKGRSRALFDWAYLELNGGAYVAHAYERGADQHVPACSYAMLPVPMLIRGSRCLGAQAIDIVTASTHRGRGLFVGLAELAHQWCASEGLAVVFGFPNSNSIRGFTHHLGWAFMDPVPFWVHPVGLRYLRSRVGWRKVHPTSFAEAANSSLPADINSLFGVLNGPTFTGVERTSGYLKWRLGRPGAGYRMFMRQHRGRTIAFGVTSLLQKHGGNVGYIMEFVVDPGLRRFGRSLLREMVSDLKAREADVILAWSSPRGDVRNSLLECGFVPLPESIRPIEMHFGARFFDPTSDSILRNEWHLSYLDSDTV